MWSKKAAIARMQENQDLKQVYEKYPLSRLLVDSAAKLERYPEYNRVSCYYAYKDWLNAATTVIDSKEYWTCVDVIDDLLPPDACDLELEGVSSICSDNPSLPDLPPLPEKYRERGADGKPVMKFITAKELMEKESFPEEDKRFAAMKEMLNDIARKRGKEPTMQTTSSPIAISQYDRILKARESKSPFPLTLELMFDHISKELIELSEKFLFSDSAFKMLCELLPEENIRYATQPHLLMLPLHPLWVEFVEPFRPYHCSPERTIKSFHFAPAYSEKMMRKVEKMRYDQLERPRGYNGDYSHLLSDVYKRAWILSTHDERDTVRRFIYDPVTQRWFCDRIAGCTVGIDEPQCVRNDNLGEYEYICPRCLEMLGAPAWWFSIAYEMVSRQFSMDETPEDFEKVHIPYKHRIPSSNPKKKKYQTGSHAYKYVTFDVSAHSKKPRSEGEMEHRGPWTEIDKDTVIYVPKSFEQSKRMLDPSRNPKWKYKREVTVKEHIKRIPMRIKTVKKVIASRFA